jgi:prepilin peptidase CpaA
MRALFVCLVVAAIIWDVRQRRIPNALSLALLGSGILYCVLAFSAWDGLRTSLAGAAVGLGCWIVFYALGVMGAGDVKFFAAASSWLGPSLSWRAALVAALLGGVLATFSLLRSGRLASTFRRLALLPFTRSLPTPKVLDLDRGTAMQQLPYGVALGLGAGIALVFPNVICGV